MQRVVADLGKLLIRRHRQEHVGRLHADLEVVEIVLLKDVRVVQRAFHQRLGVRFAVFLQQVPLQRTRVHADPHRAAVIAGGPDDLLHALGTADVAWIDAQAGRAAVGRLDRPFVVEVDVRDDRHIDLVHDILEGDRTLLVGTGHADDVHASEFRPPDLRDGAGDVGGQRVGHGLHGDRGVVAHRHASDVNAAGLPPDDLLVRPIAHEVRSPYAAAREKARP